MQKKRFDMKSFCNNKGFTLAEVLITLGIIGVVAALTLPSLIQNYQKQVWVNQLKKTVSVFENGFKKAMADDGVDKLNGTSLWGHIPSNGCAYSVPACSEFYNGLNKYFKITYNPNAEIADTTYLLSNDINKFPLRKLILASGENIALAVRHTPTNSYDPISAPIASIADIIVDINGPKKPNKYGRDIFGFGVLETGQVIPVGGDRAWESHCRTIVAYDDTSNPNYAGCMASTFKWNTSNGYGGCGENASRNSGAYCAARIIENGWKMDY